MGSNQGYVTYVTYQKRTKSQKIAKGEYHARYTATGTRVEHRDAGTDELTSRSGGYLNFVVIHAALRQQFGPRVQEDTC